MEGRPFAPQGEAFERATAWWRSMASDRDASYDDEVTLDAAAIEPTITWGINPGQAIGVGGRIPSPGDFPADEQPAIREALEFMGFESGRPIKGTPIDVAFIGSCTNGRISDLREAARIVRNRHVAHGVKALVVPGSQAVGARPKRSISIRSSGTRASSGAAPAVRCASAMNTDRLEGRQVCASSSNRNFKGRQGSPTGRTLLMSPAMVAAAALAGEIVDVRVARRGSSLVAFGALNDHDGNRFASHRHTSRARRSRCAAMTSTPTGSSPRGFCSR